jgi:hypothetical protein
LPGVVFEPGSPVDGPIPKDKTHFALVLPWAAVLSIALLIIGCGSGNSNSSALTGAQAQASLRQFPTASAKLLAAHSALLR